LTSARNQHTPIPPHQLPLQTGEPVDYPVEESCAPWLSPSAHMPATRLTLRLPN